MEDIKEYSIDDLNALLDAVKSAEKLTEEAIASQMGYNTGYIAQVRSRGMVSAKFVDALRREFKETLQNARSQPIAGQSNLPEMSPGKILTVLASAIDKQADAYKDQAAALRLQADLMRSIENKMAQQEDQLAIKEKVQATVARTEEIDSNLNQVQRDVTTLLERQESAIYEFRDQFSKLKDRKTVPSKGARKKHGQNDGI